VRERCATRENPMVSALPRTSHEHAHALAHAHAARGSRPVREETRNYPTGSSYGLSGNSGPRQAG
jgi:hypothetical protein